MVEIQWYYSDTQKYNKNIWDQPYEKRKWIKLDMATIIKQSSCFVYSMIELHEFHIFYKKFSSQKKIDLYLVLLLIFLLEPAKFHGVSTEIFSIFSVIIERLYVRGVHSVHIWYNRKRGACLEFSS